jgi:group I intron endonuclease
MLIYKITNLINNKIYIGKTIRTVELRWQEHIRDSKTGKTPLYLAMQKYGINNFKIEIINDNIDSIE